MLRLILTNTHGGQLTLLAKGAMTSESIAQLRNALSAVIGKYDEVLLDVTKVTSMDSAAAEMLVLTRTAGLVRGTTVKLIGLASARIELLLFVKLLTTFDTFTRDAREFRTRSGPVEQIRIATGRDVVEGRGSTQIEPGDFCDNFAVFSIARHRIEKGAIEQGVAELRLLREHIVNQPNEPKSVRHLLPAINEAIDAAERCRA
jgi:anti-anti-sigma regulatory factor